MIGSLKFQKIRIVFSGVPDIEKVLLEFSIFEVVLLPSQLQGHFFVILDVKHFLIIRPFIFIFYRLIVRRVEKQEELPFLIFILDVLEFDALEVVSGGPHPELIVADFLGHGRARKKKLVQNVIIFFEIVDRAQSEIISQAAAAGASILAWRGEPHRPAKIESNEEGYADKIFSCFLDSGVMASGG